MTKRFAFICLLLASLMIGGGLLVCILPELTIKTPKIDFATLNVNGTEVPLLFQSIPIHVILLGLALVAALLMSEVCGLGVTIVSCLVGGGSIILLWGLLRFALLFATDPNEWNIVLSLRKVEFAVVSVALVCLAGSVFNALLSALTKKYLMFFRHLIAGIISIILFASVEVIIFGNWNEDMPNSLALLLVRTAQWLVCFLPALPLMYVIEIPLRFIAGKKQNSDHPKPPKEPEKQFPIEQNFFDSRQSVQENRI